MDIGIKYGNVYKLEAVAPIGVVQLAMRGLNVPTDIIRNGTVSWKNAVATFGDKVADLKAVKWVDEVKNAVVTAGLNDNIDKYFNGSTYTAAWYVGLTDGTPSFAAGDTMSSHAGWTEVTAYDESVRETLTLGAAAAGSANNTGNEAVFTISANGTTIGGAFLVTNSTKGGSTGTLFGGAAFTAGDKSLDDNDTLTVTVTVTNTSA